MADGEDEGLEPRLDFQLRQDAPDVGADRADADVEALGDALIREALREGLEDLPLLGRQLLYLEPRLVVPLPLAADEA